jgi:DNA gyrase/topoisomerase IV subunit B
MDTSDPAMDSTHEDDLVLKTFSEAVKSQSMWKGVHGTDAHPIWIITHEGFRPRFALRKLDISAALTKCFDELLVNEADQYNRTCGFSAEEGGALSIIRVRYGPKQGSIRVYNNGQGFRVMPAERLRGFQPHQAGKWSVELALTAPHSSTNDSVTGEFNGGIHGIGAKAVFADCLQATVETVDAVHGLYYHQRFLDGIERIEAPRVVDLRDPAVVAAAGLTPEQCEPHTTIVIWPNYVNLCQTGNGSPWFTPTHSHGFAKYLESRCYMMVAYFSSLGYRIDSTGRRVEYHQPPRIYFQIGDAPELHVEIPDLSTYANMFPVSQVVLCHWTSTADTYRTPWQICICLRREARSKVELEAISFFNGVYLPQGGTHITVMMTRLKQALLPHLAEAIGRPVESLKVDNISGITRYLFWIDSRQASTKGFDSQSKNSLTLNKAQQTELARTYLWRAEDVAAIWAMVRGTYLQSIQVRESELERMSEEPATARTSLAAIKGLEPAKYLGPRYLRHAPLNMTVAGEGSTACMQISAMLNTKGCPYNRDHTSVYSMEGVPINAFKYTTELRHDDRLQQYIYERKEVLRNNIKFNGLIRSMGLRFDYHYYYSPYPILDGEGTQIPDPDREIDAELRLEGDRQFAELYSHRILIATDQDVDGMGQICPITAVDIFLFWPQLLLRPVGPGGRWWFLNRFDSPLVRCYPEGGARKRAVEVLEFSGEDAYRAWAMATYGNLEEVREHWTVKYYKGIGGHSAIELRNMATTMERCIVPLRWDPSLYSVARALYGEKAQARRDILSAREVYTHDIPLHRIGQVLLSRHLLIHTVEFQMEKCYRQFPRWIDGMLPSQRKAFCYARRALRTPKGRQMLVYSLAGQAGDKMKFHHGNDAFCETITKMGQVFVGSNFVPLLQPVSNSFGSRRYGRDITGQPRYIYLTYHVALDAVFPVEDDLLYDYVVDEGEMCEPKWYVPVVPMSLMTTYSTAGAGWPLASWARDFDTLLLNVRRMIVLGPESAMSLVGQPWLYEGMECRIGRLRTGKQSGEICFGTYEYDEIKRSLHISQLPIRVWSGVHLGELIGRDVDLKEAQKSLKDGKGKGKKPAAKKGPQYDVSVGKAKAKAKVKVQEEPEKPAAPGKTGREYIASPPIDKTDDSGFGTNITVELKAGSMEAIEAIYRAAKPLEVMDAVEDYFNLYQNMHAELNMIDLEGHVQSFDTYEAIQRAWFVERKALYIERIERMRILQELRRRYYTNVLRYIDMTEAKVLTLDRMPKVEGFALLEKHRFEKFHKAGLFEKQIARQDGLQAMILGEKASYKYIYDLDGNDRSAEGRAKFVEKLTEAEAALGAAKAQTWDVVWLEELARAETLIKERTARRWAPDDNTYSFKSVEEV